MNHEHHIEHSSWFQLFPFQEYWQNHAHCVLYNKYIIAFDTFGGVLTGVTYMLIPLLLARVIIAGWKFLSDPSKRLLLHGGAFIFLCGTTHFLDVWNWWHNDYHISALAKAVTGGVSAAFVWRIFQFIRYEDWKTPTDP